MGLTKMSYTNQMYDKLFIPYFHWSYYLVPYPYLVEVSTNTHQRPKN